VKKSILVFVLAVVAAVSAQAATFNWGVSLVYYSGQSPDDAGNVGLTGNLWLIDVTTAGNANGITVGSGGSLVLGTGDSLVSTGTSPLLGTYGYSENINTTIGKEFVVVGYDSVGNKYGISTVYTTELNPADSPNAKSYVFWNVPNDSLGFENGPSLELNITPVPEPASMALFGLGAGVLALRRRFKSKKTA